MRIKGNVSTNEIRSLTPKPGCREVSVERLHGPREWGSHWIWEITEVLMLWVVFNPSPGWLGGDSEFLAVTPR